MRKETKEEQRKYQTLEGLKQHRLWHMLSANQQHFLTVYIETHNRLKAAYAAFNPKSDKSANAMAARTLGHVFVVKLLDLHNGRELEQRPMARQELLTLISARLRKENLHARDFYALANLFVHLRYFKKALRQVEQEPQPEPIPDVDEMVRQLEMKRKIS